MIDWVPLNNREKKRSFAQTLHKLFIAEKFMNPVGFVLLTLASVSLTFTVIKLGFSTGVLLLIVIVALPLVYAIVVYPHFGILLLLTMAQFIMLILNLAAIEFPLGTVMDALEVILILGFFIKQKKNKDYSVFQSPVSYMILIWLAYNLLEVINPSADSQLAWLYTVRTVALLPLLYYIFAYHISTVKFIKVIIVMWLAYSVIAALYAVKQEFIGFSAFEYKILQSDPDRAALYFIDGHWRKFSFYNDPVVFAYNMVLASLLSIGLTWGPTRPWKKAALMACVVLFFVAMIFSGTRGAFVLIPAGMGLFCLLNFNKKILMFGIVAACAFLALIFIPSSDPNIHRFQTAFKPGNDASYIVRQRNQARIRPFIQSHPLGGGLGSVGVWGQKFSPNSMLAHFPPDSGYVRVAVELGWIGMIIFCTLMFVILRTGIINFFLIKNREVKAICLAMTIMVFAIAIGNYPQEALVQFPTNIYFFLMVAIIYKCPEIDRKLTAGESPVPLKNYSRV